MLASADQKVRNVEGVDIAEQEQHAEESSDDEQGAQDPKERVGRIPRTTPMTARVALVSGRDRDPAQSAESSFFASKAL